MDPDPYSEYRSGSRKLLNTDPEPQHWFLDLAHSDPVKTKKKTIFLKNLEPQNWLSLLKTPVVDSNCDKDKGSKLAQATA